MIPTEYRDYNFPKLDRVRVLGAGPSMEHYQDDGSFSIGVNWVYQRFRVDLNVATHFVVVHHVWENNDCPGLIYSRQTSDVGGTANNPKAPGIVFDAYRDLWIGSSTIITALHLAGKIAKNVDLFGCDLALSEDGRMYVPGYLQENRAKPSNEHFASWAKVIELQIEGIVNVTGMNLTRYK